MLKTFKELCALRAKKAPLKVVYLFLFCRLTYADYSIKLLKTRDCNLSNLISFPSVHCNEQVTDFHRNDINIFKNEILASTSISYHFG